MQAFLSTSVSQSSRFRNQTLNRAEETTYKQLVNRHTTPTKACGLQQPHMSRQPNFTLKYCHHNTPPKFRLHSDTERKMHFSHSLQGAHMPVGVAKQVVHKDS